MKWVILPMALLALGMMAIAGYQGGDVLREGLQVSFKRLAVFLPVLVAAFIIMGFIDVLVPKGFIEATLSDASGFKGIAIAWVAGALTPAGSLVGMPLVAGLYQAGAGVGVLVTYLTSLSVLSLIRVPLEVGFYGPRLMVVRILASLILPPVAGVVAQALAPALLKR